LRRHGDTALGPGRRRSARASPPGRQQPSTAQSPDASFKALSGARPGVTEGQAV
jgi:hypothetical protein